jgi:hypothetical protein
MYFGWTASLMRRKRERERIVLIDYKRRNIFDQEELEFAISFFFALVDHRREVDITLLLMALPASVQTMWLILGIRNLKRAFLSRNAIKRLIGHEIQTCLL